MSEKPNNAELDAIIEIEKRKSLKRAVLVCMAIAICCVLALVLDKQYVESVIVLFGFVIIIGGMIYIKSLDTKKKSGDKHIILNDEELSAIIEVERGKGRKGCIIWWIAIAICCVLALFLFINPNENENKYIQSIMILFGFIVIFGGMIYLKSIDNVKKNVGTHITLNVLNEIFHDVKYFPEKCLDKNIIDQSLMNFPFECTSISGNDYVEAKYKDVNIMMSDIAIKDINKNYKENPVFEGTWMLCDFHKKLSTELKISERNKDFKKGCTTDNEAFDKQFYIESKDPKEVFYILTPHMMEYIQAMRKKAKGTIYLSFLREGKVHIAINSGRNAFEVYNLKKDIDTLRERFRDELQYFIDIIEELRLTNR